MGLEASEGFNTLESLKVPALEGNESEKVESFEFGVMGTVKDGEIDVDNENAAISVLKDFIFTSKKEKNKLSLLSASVTERRIIQN